MNKCKCGCGKDTTKEYALGHNPNSFNRKKGKPRKASHITIPKRDLTKPYRSE